jgi:hypothetical protein
MPDVVLWHDLSAREAFMDRARAVYERIKGDLEIECGVVAIEPESGAYFVESTLGKANALAYERYPDQWVYFVRTDDPSAEIALPTW